MEKIIIDTENIRLDQFLKWAGITATGGEAKLLINQGLININGEVTKERSKKIVSGDIIKIKDGLKYIISSSS